MATTDGAADPPSGPGTWDLMPQLAANLDRHMIFPLLEHVEAQNIDQDGNVIDHAYARTVLEAKFALLSKTNMTDYIASLEVQLRGLDDKPHIYSVKRQQVMAEIERFENETMKLTELLQRDDVVNSMRSDKLANLEFLRKEHGVTIDMVNTLHEFGQYQYNCGNYGAAGELLYQFSVLSTDSDKIASATWGRLAAEILKVNWETAVEELQKVKDMIESKLKDLPRAQLDHRTWLIHWALFPLFNEERTRDQILDLFFSAAYINTIQTSCPWVLRYLAVAVIASRNSRGGRTGFSNMQTRQMKDLVRIVKQEAYEYQDPVTQFVHALCVDFDFEKAQTQLVAAEAVLRADFFLNSQVDAFVDAARHLIFESYCKIHARISLDDLASRLGIAPKDAEKWIVDLIRETRLEAKIDSVEGTVVMTHAPVSVFQQVIEKTKGGFFRTQVLNSAVAR